MWYIEDDYFVLLEDQTRTWVSFNFVPQQTMAVKFLLSYAVKNPNTTVYSGQTDLGNYIDNPYIVTLNSATAGLTLALKLKGNPFEPKAI